MQYDFDMLRPRSAAGSLKWDLMSDAAKEADITPLSVADMEICSPPEIVDALKKMADFAMWGYTIPTEPYYQAVIGWMKRKHNWSVKKETILLTTGVVQALYTAVRAFTEPGDKVLIQTPVYYPFYKCVRNNNRVLLENQLVKTEQGYRIDFEDFEKKAKEAKMFILCSPHNPVSRVWTKEELARMAEICYQNNVLVVADEIHNDLVYPPYQHTVFATIDEKYNENLIMATSASKTFSLAGLGCANLVITNPEIYQKMNDQVNLDGIYTYSIFGMEATRVGYVECDQWHEQLLAYLHGNYTYFKAFMAKHFPLVEITELEGTYLIWFDCKSFGLSPKALEVFMTEDAKLFLDEGYVFGEIGEGFERINIACPRSVLEQALNRLYEAAKQRNICGVN